MQMSELKNPPIYLSVLNSLYYWSAKWEFDGQPSLFSATLYLSSLNLLNVISAIFIAESLGASFNIPRLLAVAAPLGLFFANSCYCRLHNQSLPQPGSVPSSQARRTAQLYIWLSVALFVLATAAFIRSGPSAA